MTLIDPKLLVKPKDKKPMFGLSQVLATVLVVAGTLFVVGFWRARARGQLTACRRNLKHFGISLEMYFDDHKAYPKSLRELDGNYIKEFPTCPAVSWGPGDDTYSASYRVSEDHQSYTVYCAGANHSFADDPANYPQYNSKQGRLDCR